MTNQLFSTKCAFILTGESNVGKTTIANNILSRVLQEDINLLVSNSLNTTKFITIINFYEGRDYGIEVKNIDDDIINFYSYKTIQELIKQYNDISNLHEVVDNLLVHILIPIPNNELELLNIIFIDIIGKTLNIEKYDNIIKLLKKKYPNNILLNINKDLNHDTFKKDMINIITHADIIDYNNDNTMMIKHKEFINYIEEKIFFITNQQNINKIKLDKILIKVYDKYNLIDIFIKLYINKSKLVLNNFDDIVLRLTFPVELYKLKNEIYMCNNKLIYNIFISECIKFNILNMDSVLSNLEEFRVEYTNKLNNKISGDGNGIGFFVQELKQYLEKINKPYKNKINYIINNRLSYYTNLSRLINNNNLLFREIKKNINIINEDTLKIIFINIKNNIITFNNVKKRKLRYSLVI